MSKYNLLIVDDEEELAEGLRNILYLELRETEIFTAASAVQSLKIAGENRIDMVLTDIRMPVMDGMELLVQLLEIDEATTVVMMTAHGTIELAVESLKLGAYDFICKPFDYQAVLKIVHNGLERSRLMRENQRLRQQISELSMDTEFIGQSLPMKSLLKNLQTVAHTDYTVLVRGENGTGKELSARTIHKLSKRKNGPFIVANCPAIPEQLLESELFGHKRGAFTGAEKDKSGLFEEAHGGTICLDEIGDIPISIQTKLLRVLQEGEIRPLGDTQTKKVDARVIAMTNQNLEGKIQDKSFRQDLFYRLNVVTIRNPSLEKIKDDIPLLTSFFIKKTCQELEVPEKRFSQEALREMMHKSWPGNVRELQNVIRRSVLFSNEEIISKPYFMEVEDQGQNTLSRNIAGMYDKAEMMKYMDIKEKILHDFSNRYISDLLKSTSGNVTQAAKISGLSRAALQKIINKFSIDTNAFRAQKPSR